MFLASFFYAKNLFSQMARVCFAVNLTKKNEDGIVILDKRKQRSI